VKSSRRQGKSALYSNGRIDAKRQKWHPPSYCGVGWVRGPLVPVPRQADDDVGIGVGME